MRISLQLKLTLVSLLLLFIPAVGVHVSTIIKNNLIQNREETLMFSARAVASALTGRPGLFDQELFRSLDKEQDLYLFELSNPMRLNGKLDDWKPQLENATNYSQEHQIFPQFMSPYSSLHFTHMVGKRQEYLYAIFIVTDNKVVYRKPESLHLDRSDHLTISIENQDQQLRKYIITTDKPGWVNGFQVPSSPDDLFLAKNEHRIQGVWEETDEGYIIEMRIPMNMIGKRIAFAIADVDNEQTGEIKTVISTSNPEKSEKLGWLLPISNEIVEILESMNKPGSRIHVVDTSKRVRASIGDLTADPEATLAEEKGVIMASLRKTLHPIFSFFLDPISSDFGKLPAQLKTLDIDGIDEALSGNELITRYKMPGNKVEIMAAINPLFEKQEVIGAVVVEQTTNSIVALQNRVIEESVIISLLTFLVSSCGLLFFATRLSARIRRLRNQAASAIGKNGQLQGTIEPVKANDEIGDLTVTLSTLLTQLKQQVEYKEKMADNLEHEIRTPLAGISAALKNISQELDTPSDSISNYINWALSDAKRLENLLSAIRDATSLTDALNHDQHEIFNLNNALKIWLAHSWKPTFNETSFTLTLPHTDQFINGDPARIKQMLDKLIENGVSFMDKSTPIEIALYFSQNEVQLSVVNYGETIPEENLANIFNSMVSMRDKSASNQHLGLGLYIVRIIAEHHSGSVIVENIADEPTGVKFSVTFPRQEEPITY